MAQGPVKDNVAVPTPRPAVLALMLGTIGAGAIAQQPASFKAGVDLVRIDVAVLDSHRRPVRGLTAADFAILDEGKARQIQTFAEIDLGAGQKPSNPAPWMFAVPPDVATNHVLRRPGRAVVIVMDRSIPVGWPTRAATQIARTVIEGLGPEDLAAIVSTGGAVGQNLSSNRSRLLRTINGNRDWASGVSSEAREIENAVLPSGLPPDSVFGAANASLADGRCLCGVCVIDTLTHVIEALDQLTDRRKLIVFIASDLVLQGTAFGSVAALVGCDIRLKDARQRLFESTAQTNVTVHAFDPSGLNPIGPTGAASSTLRGRDVSAGRSQAVDELLRRQENLRVLPATTGGLAVMNTNRPELQVSQAFRESEVYYVLGIAPDEESPEGKVHKLQVRVARPDLATKARASYVSPRRADPSSARTDRTIESSPPANLLPDSSVRVRLATAVFATRDAATGTLLAAIDLADFRPHGMETASSASMFDLVVGAFDTTGRLRANASQVASIDWKVSRANGPVEAIFHLTLAPGEYDVRVSAAERDTGKSAVVFSDVTVPAFHSNPLSMSDLVLGAVTSSEHRDAGPLAIVPTTQREFSTGTVIRTSADIYQGTALKDHLEAVRVRARVIDGQDRVLTDTSIVLPPDRFEQGRAATWQATLDSKAFRPGQYLLAVDLVSGKRTAGRAVRFSIGR